MRARILLTAALAAIAVFSNMSGAFAVAGTRYHRSCDGVDTSLSLSRKQNYAALMAGAVTTTVKPSEVKIHNFIGDGAWSAVYASTPVAEDGFFFFEDIAGRPQFKEVWGGWADRSEKPQLIEWARKLGVPKSLAACFADVVTRR